MYTVHPTVLAQLYSVNYDFFMEQSLSENLCHLTNKFLTSSTMPEIKLYYGAFPFWRAEMSRLSLHLGNVSLEKQA